MAKRSKISVFFTVCLLAAIGFGGYLLFEDRDNPQIVLSHSGETVSPTLPITLTVTDQSSPLKRITVVVRFKENAITIVNSEFNTGNKQEVLTFTLSEAGLKHNDTFDLEITAVDASFGGFGFGNRQMLIMPMRFDAMPPRMSIKSSVPYVHRGGTSCVVYSINKDVAQTGIVIGGMFFPAFRQETGDFLCFFAFPYAMTVKEFTPNLVAVDVAGNSQSLNLPVTAINRQFKTDTINISQGFLDSKAIEFESMAPGAMTDIERFLLVNGEKRRQNALTLLEIGKDTAGVMLWKGAFMRLPRAASRAGFADHRTYLWQGEKVDEQTHLGFDLASLKQSPVPAANAGKVVFTGYLGIYGNMVVIDHGLGLQSLYSHMSEISVENGANVAKGDIIGKTGATGMAGGDHLHFGILVSGLEVTPLEWLDDHWIKDNIIDRIKDAGGIAPEFSVSPTPPPAAPTPKAQKTKTKPQQKQQQKQPKR